MKSGVLYNIIDLIIQLLKHFAVVQGFNMSPLSSGLFSVHGTSYVSTMQRVCGELLSC